MSYHSHRHISVYNMIYHVQQIFTSIIEPGQDEKMKTSEPNIEYHGFKHVSVMNLSKIII